MRKDKREIVVRGIGKATTPPDLIIIEMTLETTEKDYEKTIAKATEHLDELWEAVCSAGHGQNDLKTTRFNVNTKFEQYREKDAWKSRFVGYTCTHGLSLEFSLDMALLGSTLGSIGKCKANPKFTIRFTVKDPTAISEQLLENAVENAKKKATVLAKSAGVNLGEIKRIDYNWSELHMYSNTNYSMESDVKYMALEEAPMDIVPEDIDLTDTAAITWGIE